MYLVGVCSVLNIKYMVLDHVGLPTVAFLPPTLTVVTLLLA